MHLLRKSMCWLQWIGNQSATSMCTVRKFFFCFWKWCRKRNWIKTRVNWIFCLLPFSKRCKKKPTRVQLLSSGQTNMEKDISRGGESTRVWEMVSYVRKPMTDLAQCSGMCTTEFSTLFHLRFDATNGLSSAWFRKFESRLSRLSPLCVDNRSHRGSFKFTILSQYGCLL